ADRRHARVVAEARDVDPVAVTRVDELLARSRRGRTPVQREGDRLFGAAGGHVGHASPPGAATSLVVVTVTGMGVGPSPFAATLASNSSGKRVRAEWIAV